MISTLIALTLATITPAPLPSLLPSPSPTNTISEDIQKIRQAVQQKVKEKLQQITSPTSIKKAIVGKIVTISDSEITIEYKGQVKIIKLDPTLTIIDINRNKTSINKLKVGQDILALGIENSEDNSFVGKRLVVTNLTSSLINKTVTIGKIVDISKTSSILTLIPNHNKNTLFQIRLDSKSEFMSANNHKINQNEIKSGHKIIVVLRPDPKTINTYIALRITDLDYQPSPTPTKK
ncbi:MAG: hypothetical protein WAV41_03430 [Microgenomates group bacterium]